MSLRPPDKLYPGNPLAGLLRAQERRARRAGNPYGDDPATTTETTGTESPADTAPAAPVTLVQ